MQFRKNNAKVNLSRREFYFVMVVALIFVIANTVFYALAMNPLAIVNHYKNWADGKIVISFQYGIGCFVFIILALYCYFSFTHRVTVGYFFAIIWSIVITGTVVIPIVLSQTFILAQNFTNIGIYLLFLIAWFFVYKNIYENRRLLSYQKRAKGLTW